MSEVPGAPDSGPYPDPRSAFLLTVATFLATGLVGVFFLGLGAVVAIGIGQAIAVGVIATLSAKRIPEPQSERIGLRGFDLHALPLVLCLVPAILLASELDNYAADWSGEPASTAFVETFAPDEAVQPDSGDADAGGSAASDADDDDARHADGDSDLDSEAGGDAARRAERIFDTPEEAALEELRVDLDDPWTIAQVFLISVGITPVVEEFFFRGVLQQGLVARLGMARGVAFVAFLYTLPHLPAVATLPRFFAGVVSAFGLGCLLGLVRLATGSILASIVLASLSAGVGIFSFAVRESLPLPGMNVEGTHLPVTVTLASLLVVGWASHSVYQLAQQRFAAERDRLHSTRRPAASMKPPG